jgi:hypothetical protein
MKLDWCCLLPLVLLLVMVTPRSQLFPFFDPPFILVQVALSRCHPRDDIILVSSKFTILVCVSILDMISMRPTISGAIQVGHPSL